jgi:hypothetical protein
MFKKSKKEEEEMLVAEFQYRAVITRLIENRGYRVSVQRRTGLNEWTKVRCGLKGVVFHRKKDAESKAIQKIREQKSLDDKKNQETSSYVIYDN